MAGFDVGHHTAELFAGLWHSRRSPSFFRYIEAAFGVRVPGLPELRGVLVSQAETGDVRHGWVQSIALRHWVMDDRGFRPVASADVPAWARDSNAAGDAGRLYSGWAVFQFFLDGDRVAVIGTLGPELYCQMVGRLALVGGELAFTEVRMPHRPGSGVVSPRSPVRVELELRATRHAEPPGGPRTGQ
jgi:hypothetical protein